MPHHFFLQGGFGTSRWNLIIVLGIAHLTRKKVLYFRKKPMAFLRL